jgi:hypothetical protein
MKSLVGFYNKFLEGGSIANNDVNNLNAELNKILGKQLSDDLVNKKLKKKEDSEKDYELNVRTNLKPQFDKITGATKDQYNATQKANSYTEVVLDNLKTGVLLIEANDVLSAKVKLNDISKELLDVKFSPSLEGFKNYTVRDGLRVLRIICLTPDQFNRITKGKARIFNSEIVDSDKIDPESIYFLKSLIKQLSEGALVDISAKQAPRVLFSSLRSMIQPMDSLTESIEKLVIAKNKAVELISGFPDFTLNVVTLESRNYTAVTVPDVTTEKTPYISANGGIGYSTAFTSAVNYYGANFYLAPVNKKAPLRTFKGWNLIKKIVCVNVAVSNYFGTRHQNTSSILGGNGTDLLLGLGFRVNRIIEFNTSWLPYKSGTNPIISNKELKCDFIIGAAIDVNLLVAFSSVAKGLKLIP